MSAEILREAARVLRERALVTTPGEWINFGNAIGVTVKGCTCAGPVPGYPQHENYCGTEGPIVDAGRTDIAYIATMHPGVGLAIAQWLSNIAHNWDAQSGGLCADAEDVARLILGGAS